MDKNKLASDCYRKAVEGMNKQNWPLAVEMFAMAVKFVPDNLGYRQNLRGCTQRKLGDKSKIGALTKTKLLGLRNNVKKAKAQEKWDEVDKLCEEGLQINPWDSGLNADLADACMKRGWSEIAAWSLSIARKEDPNNKELNLRLVEVLRERGQHDEAASVLMHLQKLFPQDGEIRKLMTSVQFTATIERGKYEDAGSTRDVMVNKAQLNKAEAAAPGQSPEADLKHAIRKDPANKENYLKLADFYRRQRNPRAAAEQLEKALEVSGGDPGVRELLEDVQLELMQVNLDAAKQIAAASAADQDRQQAVALSQELLKREIEVLSARVERYPADLGRKFELAQRFMRVQKWTLAIPLLQKASSDPRLRTRALVSLAKSFVADRKTSLARGQLERAIPDINLDHERGLYLEASYLLGRVCEELGDRAAAENAYQQVIVYEYDYKDAEKRLSALQQKQPSPDANKPGAGG